jgi:hypothetical protein
MKDPPEEGSRGSKSGKEINREIWKQDIEELGMVGDNGKKMVMFGSERKGGYTSGLNYEMDNQ